MGALARVLQAMAQELEEALVWLIGDKAYVSDRLDARLAGDRDMKLIAPNRSGRGFTQNGRQLRRYCPAQTSNASSPGCRTFVAWSPAMNVTPSTFLPACTWDAKSSAVAR